ncbi:MAG TPA: cyclic nucleotide-binding domain-containing protein [Thermoanaerobaculaceae bacterium]|nr:cyclic nucleotide-binding domain-containing protein [Thermoanaerobaculaceae bacterium]
MPPTAANGNEPIDSPQHLARFKAGEYIFRETEPGTEMFIIQEGKVEILRKTRGKERRVALLEEGDFFGEMAILEDLPRSASARAVDACALLRIDSTTFDQMVRHHPEIPVRMLRKLSSRLREADLHLEADVTPGSGERSGIWQGKPAAEKQPPAPAKPPAKPVAAAKAKAPARVTPQNPRFVHKGSGTEFPLAPGDKTYVGRFDATTGFQPEIDLREVDTDRSTSRRHARIERREDLFFLREEIGTANGTYVGGQRVATGVDVELNDGDEVKFGRVRMVFHTS